MSEHEARAKGKNDLNESDLPLTRNQALAVAWSGIEVLARRGEAEIRYDPEKKITVIFLANTKATSAGFTEAEK